MGKFKEGDKVRLKEGAVYPQNGEPWSESDSKMIPGAVFEVQCIGKYSWKNIEYDCVGLKHNSVGWIPEDCFDFAELKEGWYVPCNLNMKYNSELFKYRNYVRNGENYSWIDEGYIDDKGWHCFKSELKNKRILTYQEFLDEIYNPWKAQQSITTLPEKWYVLCDRNPDSTPELLEWRKGATTHGGWSTTGTISETGYWRNRDSSIGIELPYSTFLELVYKPWKATQKEPSIEPSPKKEPSMPTDPRIVTSSDVGAKVVRGRDWSWGDQDKNGVGTILGLSSQGWVTVKWNNGDENSYRIGVEGKYDLYYLNSTSTIYDVQHLYEPKPSTTSYSTPDETPRLTIKKSKTKLLSTEVKELNVNLKLLKNN